MLNRVPPYYEPLQPILEGIQSGDRPIDCSVVTEAEMLVRPMRYQRAAEIDTIDAFFSHGSVRVWNVNREIGRAAARIRAAARLKLPDALIVATAIVSGCDAVVGNDEMCARRVTEIPYIYLDDVVKEHSP